MLPAEALKVWSRDHPQQNWKPQPRPPKSET